MHRLNSPIHTFIKFINSLFHCTYSFLHCVHSFLHRFIGDAGGEGRLLRHRGPGHQARRRHAHHEEGHGWRSSGLYPRFPFVFVVFLCICVCASMFFNPCFFHPWLVVHPYFLVHPLVFCGSMIFACDRGFWCMRGRKRRSIQDLCMVVFFLSVFLVLRSCVGILLLVAVSIAFHTGRLFLSFLYVCSCICVCARRPFFRHSRVCFVICESACVSWLKRDERTTENGTPSTTSANCNSRDTCCIDLDRQLPNLH